MGYPASDIEALYRNNKDHVKTFLEYVVVLFD